MAFYGEFEAVTEPGTGHQAKACMGGSSADRGTTMAEKSRPVVADTTSHDRHEAAIHEQQATRTTRREEAEAEGMLLSPAACREEEGDGQENTREKLKRHRREMGGTVWVPEMWGQEKLLKDWLDCSAFDRPLVPAGLLTARRALVAESCNGRPVQRPPASSSPLRAHNGCS